MAAKEANKLGRKSINTTLKADLYRRIQFLALKLQVNANELIEEGMEYVLKKYGEELPENDPGEESSE